jgi:hypothetical protein
LRTYLCSAGQQLSDRRRKLEDDIVEAQECLKSMMRNGLLVFERAEQTITYLRDLCELLRIEEVVALGEDDAISEEEHCT